MVIKRQNRKDQSVSAIFLIYSIFNNRNQISFLQWLEKSGVSMLFGGLQPIFNWQSSISRQICHVFNMCMCARGRGEGQGVWISHLWYPVFLNFRLLHSNILCSVCQFHSLTVPFSGTHCITPFALTPPVPLPSAPSATSKLVLLTSLLCGNRRPFLYSVVLALCFSCYPLAVAYFI